MNLQSALGLTLAGVSLVCSIGFLMHRVEVLEHKSDPPRAPTSYIEPMPETGDESFRVHFLDDNGVEKEIHVNYKDKSTGVLTLDDGKTVLERRYYTDGKPRKFAVYNSDGELTAGFEHRSDRSLLWETNADEGRIVTRVFRPGGELFHVRVLELKTKLRTSTFFRADGSMWERTVYAANQLASIERFDESGRLRMLQTVMQIDDPVVRALEMFNSAGPWPVMKVIHLKEDGSTDFVQWVAFAADVYWHEDSDQPNPNPLFVAGVEEYRDGKLLYRSTLDRQHRVRSIDTIYPDGAIQRLHADRRGKIYREEFITANGTSSQYDYTGRFGKVGEANPRLLVKLPINDEPTRDFNEQEAQLEQARLDRERMESLSLK